MSQCCERRSTLSTSGTIIRSYNYTLFFMRLDDHGGALYAGTSSSMVCVRTSDEDLLFLIH